jgi:predicted secreted protein
MAVKLGKDAKLYRAPSLAGSPTWTEVPNVRDLTLNLETGEADVTTRGNGGWRATVATLKDASIEFEMVWDTADANFTAIRNAFISNASLAVAVADGELEVETTQGFAANVMVTNFTRNESLEEAITVSVSMKPTYSTNAPAWFTELP